MSRRVGRRSSRGALEALFRFGTASGLSDGQLLERFAERHDEAAEAAFAALIERHGAMVWRVCSQALTDSNDARDAFQATFLVLMRKANSVRRHDSLGAWLYGVARRVARRARTESARRKVVETAAGSTRPWTTEPRSDDTGAVIWEEVDRLPSALRTAVVHCYLQGLTHEQAASRLGWPVGTVRSRLARARERLRGRLERRGLAPSLVVGLPGLSGSISWPITLVDSTARAALTLAARDAASAGLVSTAAASLTEGVLQTMFMGTLKNAAVAAVVLTGTLLTGAGVYAFQDEAPRREREGERRERAEAREEEARRDGANREREEARPRPEFADSIQSLVAHARELQERGRFDEAFRALQEIHEVADAWARSLNQPASRREELPARSPRSPIERPRVAGKNLTRTTRDPNFRPMLAPARVPEVLQERTLDHQRRLDALEKKLDRVLEALEGRRTREGADSRPRTDPFEAATPRRQPDPLSAPSPRHERPARDPAPDRTPRERPARVEEPQDARRDRRPEEPAAPEPPKPPVAPVAPVAPTSLEPPLAR
ncbi:MAG: sigma-70 family RNA polymerase sigma factor [Isosphaeraceae bacterium]